MISVLDHLFLQPLIAFHAALFGLFEGLPMGWRVIAFGLLLNLLLIPVYRRMEQASQVYRAKRALIDAEVARIKRYFHGRERYFYLRTVYRQHGESPWSALKSSTDLALQMVVFTTVYQFLSGLESLQGVGFGPIHDLAQPDGLLGGVNALPLLMTAINTVSVWRYTVEPTRRVQAIALALLFLVLLYASPSGMVLYWTLNNLFSLLRQFGGGRWQVRWPARWRPDPDLLLQR